MNGSCSMNMSVEILGNGGWGNFNLEKKTGTELCHK